MENSNNSAKIPSENRNASYNCIEEDLSKLKYFKTKISNFHDVQRLCAFAKECESNVYACDVFDSGANAKSLLSLMSLNYHMPVTIYYTDDLFYTAFFNNSFQ